MKKVGTTLEKDGEYKDVYECEFCGNRSTDYERIRRCEIHCDHQEEWEAGVL